MNDLIKAIWHRNDQHWLNTRADILATTGVRMTQNEVFDIINDIGDQDRIAPCGKVMEFKRWDRGYQTCSNKCPCAISKKTESAEKTSMAKYGLKNPMQDAGVRDRFKETMLERHGSAHALQNADLLKKARKTMTENNDPKDIVAKMEKTNLERYGCANAMQNVEIREKARETMFERHGGRTTMTSPALSQRVRETNIKKYGKDYHQQAHVSDEHLAVLKNKEKIRATVTNKSISTISKEMGIYETTFTKYWYSHGLPKLSNSSYEVEVAAFLDDLGIIHERNSRKIIPPQELDFFIPSLNIAIEFNGIYWHSSNFVDKDYHRRKYELCRAAGIRLLMINEDEWNERRGAWRDRIRNILQLSARGLPARKLELQEIGQPLMNAFCDANHIQGATTGAIYCLGGYSGDILMGVMAFGKQRGSGAIELTRFCTDGSSHAGLFSRMFRRSVAENGFTDVLSFADLRHSDGGVYRSNGFDLVAEIAPDYRYLYRGTTYHKFSFTKRKIAERFPDEDFTGKTERQSMEMMNIPRLYDCGKLKFLWRSKG